MVPRPSYPRSHVSVCSRRRWGSPVSFGPWSMHVLRRAFVQGILSPAAAFPHIIVSRRACLLVGSVSFKVVFPSRFLGLACFLGLSMAAGRLLLGCNRLVLGILIILAIFYIKYSIALDSIFRSYFYNPYRQFGYLPNFSRA